MKTFKDIQARLRNELNQWFIKQCRNQFIDYYLYHLPSTPKHDGGLLILSENPPNKEYKLSWNMPINKGATIDQNFNSLQQCLRQLPILSIK